LNKIGIDDLTNVSIAFTSKHHFSGGYFLKEISFYPKNSLGTLIRIIPQPNDLVYVNGLKAYCHKIIPKDFNRKSNDRGQILLGNQFGFKKLYCN
jgi:hypothetical protein